MSQQHGGVVVERHSAHSAATQRGLAAGIAIVLATALAGWSLRAAAVRAQPSTASESLAGPSDTAPTLLELSQWRRDLGSPDPALRARALAALSQLGADALPAIEKRLAALARHGFDEGVVSALSELRRVQGVDAPDGDVDLALGVLPLLAADRSESAVAAAELVALLRSLERQRSPRSTSLLVDKLFALDGKLFRYEAQRTRTRLGVSLIPALIRHRMHARSWIRAYCEESLAALGIKDPGRAVQQDDVGLLAAILLAYGDTLRFDAMPVVVSYVTDERIEVREAARAALARFGKNAIWQLRERYVNATGKDADPSWGHQRLLDELLQLFEAPKQAAFEQALARAQGELAQAHFEAALTALDAALTILPLGGAAARAAPLYRDLAQHFEAGGRAENALTCWRRAARLAPDAAETTRVRARVLFLEAELRLGAGQVDLRSYERALTLDPSLEEARQVLDELSGKNAESERAQRRALGLLAALVLVLSGIFALRGGRVQKLEPRASTALAAVSEAAVASGPEQAEASQGA